MLIKNKPLFWRGLLLAGDVLLLDQISKWVVLEKLGSQHAPVPVLPFFDVALVWNSGISFGLMAGKTQPLFFIALSLAIVAVLLRWLYKNRLPLVAIGLGMVVGGAIGNVIDRLRFGGVVDFLDFHVLGHHWPAFNIADSSIFIGVVVLCLSSMLDRKGAPA